MFKNITITIGFLFIWGSIGGFDWFFDSIECIRYNSDLINQVKIAQNTIDNLSNEISIKEIIIIDYKKEILDWTSKYNKISEQLELTKHSLNLANQALNSLTDQGINDSSDYE